MTDAAPLEGIRVIDFSIMAAGPWAGSLLGQLGADVIKVQPLQGDGSLQADPKKGGISTNYAAINTNKRSIALDLKAEADYQKAIALLKTADVLLVNFRPGVMQRLRLDWQTVKKINPNLIYCDITGWGYDQSLADMGAADYIVQAKSGFACLNGAPGETFRPFKHTGIIDFTTAATATESILYGLIKRQETGKGGLIELAMLDVAIMMQTFQLSLFLNGGETPHPLGSGSDLACPDGAFKAKDKWIALTIATDRQWADLCTLLGDSALAADVSLARTEQRLAQRQRVQTFVADVLEKASSSYWLGLLKKANIPSSLFLDADVLHECHHCNVSDMIVFRENVAGEDVRLSGTPWRFANSPVVISRAPGVTEHQEEIESEIMSQQHQMVVA